MLSDLADLKAAAKALEDGLAAKDSTAASGACHRLEAIQGGDDPVMVDSLKAAESRQRVVQLMDDLLVIVSQCKSGSLSATVGLKALVLQDEVNIAVAAVAQKEP